MDREGNTTKNDKRGDNKWVDYINQNKQNS